MENNTIRDRFFAAHPEPMWVYDLDTLRFLAVNDAAVDRYGYSREEFFELTIADIRPTEDRDALAGNVMRVSDGLDRAGIWRHRLKSGEVVDVEIVSHTIAHEGRRAELVLARDATRLVELERAHAAYERLREQDANLRTAQRLLGLGFWKIDLDTGQLTWSDEVYAMYGVPPDAFDGSFDAYVALVHPDDREQMLARFDAFADAGERNFDFEHRILRPAGGVIHVRGVGELTESGASGILTGVVEDITERKASEIAVRESELQLRLAGKAARLGAWRVTLDPLAVSWSDETVAIHGLPPGTKPTFDEAIGYCAPEYRERVTALFEACVRDGVPYDEVLELIRADGERVWVRAIGEPERDGDGRVSAVRGAFQDISDLVEARRSARELDLRLRATLESISDAFFTLDRDWNFEFLNGEAERLLARPRDALIGRSVWQEFPDAVGSAFEREYRRAVAQRRTVKFTEYYPPLEVWFDVSAYPTDDGLAVYFRDVTEARAREEQLRLLETAVSRQNDILLITEAEPLDAPDGPKIVYVNDAFVRRTGYSRDEVIGRTPRLLQGDGTQRAELDRIRRALERRQPVRAELVNYTRAGQPIWLELDIVALTDASGAATHFVSVERDVTERRKTEEAARVSEERFRIIAKATNDVIWDWDLVAGTVWWNESFIDVFGYRPQDIEPGPESWSNRIHPDDRAAVLDSIHDVIEGRGSVWESEYRFVHASGLPVTVIDRGFVIRDGDGRAVRMVGSMIDVTERRELDERLKQSQKLEAVGQLTGGVAHDFNNLLTVILGNAELLGEQLGDRPQLRSLAEMTAEAASRGAELTSRLLAFARRQALEPKLVDINRLIAGMDGLLRRTLTEEVEIEFVRAGGLWQVEVDPGQLEAALLNLAINARDAMSSGGRLTIETANAALDDEYAARHEDVEAGQYVVVSVTDTGAGMDADVAAHAFDPFFTTKPVGEGSGLGLSMVYGFVKQSGGHAKIYTEVGEGTAVKLYFPRVRRQAAAAGPAGTARVAGGGREHVLVVEDDELVRDHVTRQLKDLGYAVSMASSGPEALALLERRDDVDLLFTDVVMPGGMNGRELADAARARRPALKLLFTSGYTENAIVHQGRLDRGVDLLSKPYRRQELAAKLRKVLDASSD